MKLAKMTTKTAEHVIVYGKDLGFSMVKPAGISLTIYHREFEGEHYDIAEMNTETNNYDEKGDPIVVTTFYLLDPKEALQICGLEEDYFEKDTSKSV